MTLNSGGGDRGRSAIWKSCCRFGHQGRRERARHVVMIDIHPVVCSRRHCSRASAELGVLGVAPPFPSEGRGLVNTQLSIQRITHGSPPGTHPPKRETRRPRLASVSKAASQTPNCSSGRTNTEFQLSIAGMSTCSWLHFTGHLSTARSAASRTPAPNGPAACLTVKPGHVRSV